MNKKFDRSLTENYWHAAAPDSKSPPPPLPPPPPLTLLLLPSPTVAGAAPVPVVGASSAARPSLSQLPLTIDSLLVG